MTKTDWTAEEVRLVLKLMEVNPSNFDPAKVRAMLTTFAERIERAQAGVPVDYPECSGDPKSCPENEGFGCCAEHAAPITLADESAVPVAWMSPNKESLEFSRPETVYGSHIIPLFTHPPAQPAQEQPRVPDGWKLAMYVLQSDMYQKLPEEERAVCEALAQENPYIATAPTSKPERDG